MLVQRRPRRLDALPDAALDQQLLGGDPKALSRRAIRRPVRPMVSELAKGPDGERDLEVEPGEQLLQHGVVLDLAEVPDGPCDGEVMRPDRTVRRHLEAADPVAPPADRQIAPGREDDAGDEEELAQLLDRFDLLGPGEPAVDARPVGRTDVVEDGSERAELQVEPGELGCVSAASDTTTDLRRVHGHERGRDGVEDANDEDDADRDVSVPKDNGPDVEVRGVQLGDGVRIVEPVLGQPLVDAEDGLEQPAPSVRTVASRD